MRNETILKMAFFAGFFVLLFLVIWIELPAETKLAVEKAIREYQGILLSIGTLVLISLLALAAAQISSSSAERRDVSNRRIQAELQIATFRQAWILDIRNDLAELNQIFLNDLITGNYSETGKLVFSIQVRLNRKNSESRAVFDIISGCISGRAKGDQEKVRTNLVQFQTVVSDFLKVEWDRLKENLETAQITEL